MLATSYRSTLIVAIESRCSASWASLPIRLVLPKRRGATSAVDRPARTQARRVSTSASRPVKSSGGTGPSKTNGDGWCHVLAITQWYGRYVLIRYGTDIP